MIGKLDLSILSMKDKSACPIHTTVSTDAETDKISFGEGHISAGEAHALAKVRLSHTPAEHQLYEVMLAEVSAAKTRVCAFSLRQLMTLTRLPNYSAIRRGLEGLINKLSIERHRVADGAGLRRLTTVYFVFTPEEILGRRVALGRATAMKDAEGNTGLVRAIDRMSERNDLSRREAQVALCCAEGLTNTEIGKRLYISEQTVKFHLRHIFVKYGVRRRTELISQLLSQVDELGSRNEFTK